MHKSYHINRDLPLNAVALPAEPVCVDQPVRVLDPAADRQRVVKFSVALLFWCAALSLMLVLLGHILLPLAVAVWLPPLVVLTLGGWCFLLARHGITLWTGLPVDLATSRRLRDSLTVGSLLGCGLPCGSALVLCWLENPKLAAAALGVWGIAACWSWLSHPVLTVCAYGTALHSYLTYNRQSTRSPGLLLSPAGPCEVRQVQLAVTLLITATLVPALNRIAIGDPVQLVWESVMGQGPFDVREGLPLPEQPSWEEIRQELRARLPSQLIQAALVALSGPLLVLGVGFLSTAPVLTAAYRARLAAGDDDPTWWSRTRERMRASRNQHVLDAVLWGWHIFDDSPAMVPQQACTEHVLLTGPTGSGKTTVLMQLLRQLLVIEPSSLLLFNMKGKELTLLATLQTIQREAEARFGITIPLKIYSNISGWGVHACNPCDQTNRDRLDLDQFVDNLLTASGLSYGRGYGQGHFSTANEYVLRRATDTQPDFRSFRQLHQALAREPLARGASSTKQLREHGADALAVLEKLAAIEGLNVTDDGSDTAEQLAGRIDFSAEQNLLTRPEIHYFHFSVDHGAELAALQANLILHTFFGAASSEQQRRQVPVWCAIDEMQELLQRQLGKFYRLARSAGAGLIGATQSEANLRDGNLDLRDVVLDNSCIHVRTGIHNDDEQLRVVRTSGEVLDDSGSYSQSTSGSGRTGVSAGWQEHRDPRLNQNLVKAASAAPQLAILEVKRNLGYAAYDGQKIVIRTRFDITAAEFEERERCTWPPLGPEQVTQRSGLTMPAPSVPTLPAAPPSPPDFDEPPPASSSEAQQPDQQPQTMTTIFDQLREEQQRRQQTRRTRRRRRRNP